MSSRHLIAFGLIAGLLSISLFNASPDTLAQGYPTNPNLVSPEVSNTTNPTGLTLDTVFTYWWLLPLILFPMVVLLLVDAQPRVGRIRVASRAVTVYQTVGRPRSKRSRRRKTVRP